MGFSLSRSTRISIVLALTSVFFVVELGVGYYANSLALIADSFHMLNDLLSMVIALYAIKLTARAKNPTYSYGLHRAEILAALTNGIFLLALCFSIILEALGRFYTQPDVKDPKLVVVVGSLGLLCNIVGLLLFHEHGHGHSHGHSHGHDHEHKHEHSHSHRHKHHHDEEEYSLLAEGEPKDDAAHSHSHSEHHETCSIATRSLCPPPLPTPSSSQSPSPPPLYETLSTAVDPEAALPSPKPHSHGGCHHGHDHSSMNMRALVLHVMGDALGNLGVIFTGLVMWLTKWSFRFYFDPAISLLIAILISLSAVPLVRSASRILLQASPAHVCTDTVKNTILGVPGVVGCHELHVWQLSESRCVASVHVELDTSARVYMDVAAEMRRKLGVLGIEDVTIQPEFVDASKGEANALETEKALRMRASGSGETAVSLPSSSSDDTLCIHSREAR